jgi:6-phosphogluconolactonase
MSTETLLKLPDHVGQNVFDDAESMATALADRVAAMLRLALRQRGEATLVVPGGKSPVAFFQALARRKLNWARVTVTLADERWLPSEHPDSNAGLVQAHLLQGPAAAARFVPLYGGESTPAAGLEACAQRLAELPRPFDVVLLGMGEDGHFASLFPGTAGLADLLDEEGPALAEVIPPAASHARMSLGLSALTDARHVLVQIQGQRKAEVIEAAGSGAQYPIGALLRQRRCPVQVFFSSSD